MCACVVSGCCAFAADLDGRHHLMQALLLHSQLLRSYGMFAANRSVHVRKIRMNSTNYIRMKHTCSVFPRMLSSSRLRFPVYCGMGVARLWTLHMDPCTYVSQCSIRRASPAHTPRASNRKTFPSDRISGHSMPLPGGKVYFNISINISRPHHYSYK